MEDKVSLNSQLTTKLEETLQNRVAFANVVMPTLD